MRNLSQEEINNMLNTIKRYNRAIKRLSRKILRREDRRPRVLSRWQRGLSYYSQKANEVQTNLNNAINKEKASVNKPIDDAIERINNFYKNKIEKFTEYCIKVQSDYDLAKQPTVIRLNNSISYRNRLLQLAEEAEFEYQRLSYLREARDVEKNIKEYQGLLERGQEHTDKKKVGCNGEPENSNSPIFQRNQGVAYQESKRGPAHEFIENKYRNSGGYETLDKYQAAVTYIQNRINSINAAFDFARSSDEGAIAYFEAEIALIEQTLREYNAG